ncbi:hypothetical protein SAMN06295905_1589 [Devosia lucknowensis]|uniref:Copper(I)-binding protein n=1 Tax=Devosia lucknowensis TaxID=1096929 RepID=A0A1Y6F717_9HYPH|nr:hypothetical protein [Devosia lucknowensis]SMQ68572.1 hypothetical protein SAMN06295905_1589 [Devosia lucknowensis]
MKQALISILVSVSCMTPVVSQELPVAVVDGLLIEEAWASTGPAGTEIFLVVNNTTTTGIGPIGIEVDGASSTRVLRSDGQEFVPSLPPHAELYMQPRGVRIEAIGLPVTASIPVTVSVGEASATVEARLLGPGQPPPDHHDYRHG